MDLVPCLGTVHTDARHASRNNVRARETFRAITPSPHPMKDLFSKENLLNFLLIAVATAVGVVVIAPYVAKGYAKLAPAH